MRWRSACCVFVAAICITALPFYRVLFFEDRALLYRDLYRHFLVGKAIWADAVRAGEGIPYWNNHSFGGMRFWAENVNSPLHPLNSVFLFFSPPDYPLAMNYYIWLHYVFLFLGAYLLCRVLRRKVLPSLLLATSMALSGVSISASNVTHSMSSFVSAPWFVALWILHLRTGSLPALFGASLGIAWPIYAGDPQLSYVMAFIAFGMIPLLSSGSLRSWVARYAALGTLALLAASAQLLPTIEFILDSGRGLGAMKREELVAFSFHPARLADTFWPQFFGNRFGGDPYWGEDFVNFVYKTPFIFSTYPGTLTLLLTGASVLVAVVSRRRRARILILGCTVGFGLLVCFGELSWIPLYDLLLAAVPLFGAFRYPERLLFWPYFALWGLAVAALPALLAILRHPQLRRRALQAWAGFAALNAAVLASLLAGYPELPGSAFKSVASTTALVLVFGVIFGFFSRRVIGTKATLIALLLTQAAELAFVQTRLLWDQSKFIADGRRYPMVGEIAEELRKEKFRLGAARRFNSLSLSSYKFITGEMDHATFSTFAGFESLVSNIPGLYGIDDIGGYFALVSSEKSRLWTAIREQRNFQFDYSRLLDLTGTYFVPRRGEAQKIVLDRNEDALPYLFLARAVVAAPDFEEALRELRTRNFRSVTTVTPLLEANEVSGRGLLRIEKRTGRDLSAIATNLSRKHTSFLVWNESYDRHWAAYVNGQRAEVYRANAWAIGVFLKPNEKGDAEVRFVYENPLITLGCALSASWVALFVAVLLRSKATRRSGEESRPRQAVEARV